MVQPVWKLISLLLGLVVFLGVGMALWVSGEDLIWIVGKSIGSFFVCWIVLGQLGNMLMAVMGSSTSRKNNES